mmetsp:Transcript_13285/g.19542  ORF Transcript_13285/g.19542 Transcript_13285/m.19542 type:complete len:89 (-) Transcript_13285:1033-1299(-)
MLCNREARLKISNMNLKQRVESFSICHEMLCPNKAFALSTPNLSTNLRNQSCMLISHASPWEKYALSSKASLDRLTSLRAEYRSQDPR